MKFLFFFLLLKQYTIIFFKRSAFRDQPVFILFYFIISISLLSVSLMHSGTSEMRFIWSDWHLKVSSSPEAIRWRALAEVNNPLKKNLNQTRFSLIIVLILIDNSLNLFNFEIGGKWENFFKILVIFEQCQSLSSSY